ncbi:MAG: hypothetical protein DRP42_04645 [Tenericutes bacterium]|nr:MAG: hypothetical protein DRP42_04645 [Mycoplasmatota bacterium]
MILVILGILTIFFILPMMSKKRFGQTLGKKALNITPLYLSSENKYASYLKRELPIMGIYMIPVVLTLFIGNDPTFVYSQYTKFLSEVGVNNSLRPNNAYDFYMNH